MMVKNGYFSSIYDARERLERVLSVLSRNKAPGRSQTPLLRHPMAQTLAFIYLI